MINALSTPARGNSLYPLAGAQPAPAATQLVDLAGAVQQFLHFRKLQAGAVPVIIRMEALPQINGERQVVNQLVSLMLNTIVAHPPAGTRLLLYIKCEKERPEIADLSLAEGFQPYVISVYTNIVTDEAWQEQHQEDLASLHTLAAHL